MKATCKASVGSPYKKTFILILIVPANTKQRNTKPMWSSNSRAAL